MAGTASPAALPLQRWAHSSVAEVPPVLHLRQQLSSCQHLNKARVTCLARSQYGMTRHVRKARRGDARTGSSQLRLRGASFRPARARVQQRARALAHWRRPEDAQPSYQRRLLRSSDGLPSRRRRRRCWYCRRHSAISHRLLCAPHLVQLCR